MAKFYAIGIVGEELDLNLGLAGVEETDMRCVLVERL